MTYDDAIRFLYDLRLHGLKLGLENTRRLAAECGDPHQRLRFIHVAGTNGKGSTCAMLESIYRQAGLRVGLFTSPHLVSFRERIQVNRQPIGAADVVRLVAAMQRRVAAFPEDHPPTFFEVVTVVALQYFVEQQCDLVVWETGLGGRLDATNIVTPLASLITNIQFDHERWLGHTRAAIAREKAGIIKPGVPVFTATDDPEALAVLENVAAAAGSPFHRVPPGPFESGCLAGLTLPLLGDHQRQNAALALAAVEALRGSLVVSDAAIRQGLERVEWLGRLQTIRRPGGGRVVLDGAHNAAGAEALAAALRTVRGQDPLTLVLGVLEDKDWRSMCHALAPLARRVLLVPVKCERTASPEALRDACAQAHPAAIVETPPDLADALERAAGDPLVVVAGSLYLVGEALECLGPTPMDLPDERALNEWRVPVPVPHPGDQLR